MAFGDSGNLNPGAPNNAACYPPRLLSSAPEDMYAFEKIMEKVKSAFFLRNTHTQFFMQTFFSKEFLHLEGCELHQAMRDRASYQIQRVPEGL